MDVTAIASLISTVGFPIACTCAMFYMWNKEREDHKETETKMITAIDNNTAVMEKLIEKVKETTT